MKHIKFSLILAALASLASCVNYKYVYKGNTVYRIQSAPPVANTTPVGTPPPPVSNTLERHTVTHGFWATISEKDDYIIIKPNGTPTVTTTNSQFNILTGWRNDNQGKYYFPEAELDQAASVPHKLRYFDIKPVLQALTVPLKIRPKWTDDAAVKDSFPSQAETSFNVGIAAGCKFTHNVYSSRKGIFGQNTNRYSFTPGVFFGTGATDLKKTNTRSPSIEFERKAPIITTGGFFMVGFNSVNIGYSFGADFAFGKGSKEWMYKGKLWHGVIVAIDIIK